MVYKVLVDLDTIDLNSLVEDVTKKEIEFCVAEDCLYFHTNLNTSTKISNIMKRMNSSGFIIKEVKIKPKNPEVSFADLWCFEKMNADEEREFNEKHQDELHTMLDNIERIRQNLIKDKLLKEEPDGEQ